ncbi:hypothetical protein V5799_032096 [Amblyomma americanum]|uniref:Uncharacterized protein n=1 Tax=Amblyomma americanum TaxID=6943 RepID=A0AAQ4DS50_AMBAM
MGSQPPSRTDASPPRLDDLGAHVPVYPIARVPAARLHPGASPEDPDIVVIMQPPLVPHPSPEETATSPELRFQDRNEETAQDERLCMQAWVLCAAVCFPLVFASWLLLVPYLVHGAIPPGGGQMRTLPTYPSQTVPAPTFSMTSPTASFPATTFTIPSHSSPSLPPSAFTVPSYVPFFSAHTCANAYSAILSGANVSFAINHGDITFNNGSSVII